MFPQPGASEAGTDAPGPFPAPFPADAPVVIVGAGPVGVATALGLAHHGVRSVLIERDATPSVGSKAFGVWGRTLEVFDAWGLSRALIDAGDPRDAISPVRIDTGRPIFTIDFACLADESPMPGLLLIPQNATERVLRNAARASSLITWVTGAAVTVSQDDAGVTVGVSRADAGADAGAGVSGEVTQVRGEYLVGADGSRSVVRESQGVRHAGRIIDIDLVVFDVEVPDEPADSVVRLDARRPGLLAALRFAPGRWRVLASTRALRRATTIASDGPPPRRPDIPVADLAAMAARLLGRGEGSAELRVTWQSQTTLYQQRVPHFRLGGRILLAGDAAHLISPAGGQGMNQGIQDAENLAFSLAAALSGAGAGADADADAMLDGYARERERIADAVARRAHLNTLLEFATPTWLRPFGFWGLRVLTRQRWLMRPIARRLSMRDLRYAAGDSARLGGVGGRGLGRRRSVGRRLADVVLASGVRLTAELAGRAGVVTVGADLPAGLECAAPCVRLEAAPARSRLRRGDVAVVRPDRTIAAVLRRPSQGQLDSALLLAGWAASAERVPR